MAPSNNIYTLTENSRNEPPDEFLANLANAPSLVPVRPRDNTFNPPDADLLRALHYYIAQRYPETEELYNESALLALGYLVEHWIDEALGPDGALVYGDGLDKEDEDTVKPKERQSWKIKSSSHIQDKPISKKEK